MSIVEIIYDAKSPKLKPNTLHLFLRYKWYDMIASGEKREEYRAIRTWVPKIVDEEKSILFYNPDGSLSEASRLVCKYEWVCFHRAYSNTTIIFHIDGLRIGVGKPEWRESKDKVLIICLGDTLEEVAKKQERERLQQKQSKTE